MKSFFAFSFSLLCFACVAQAKLSVQQKLFKTTYNQALKGDTKAVKKAKPALENYRLKHYLDYGLIKSNMPSLPVKKIKAFGKKHPKSPLLKSLNKMLTYEYGKQHKWKKYLENYKNNKESQKKHCWYLQARIATKDFKGLNNAIEATWMNGFSLPKECNSVFTWWEKQGQLNDTLLAKRIKLSYKVNNASTTRFLAAKMKNKPIWVKHAVALMKNPLPTLKNSLQWKNNEINQELVYLKAKQTAQKQPNSLYKLWGDLKKHFSFSDKQIEQVERTNALFAATDYLPFTIKAMNNLSKDAHDGQISGWKVRFYLQNQDWQGVVAAIEKMEDFQKKTDRWQYWLARSYAKTGQTKRAQEVFTKLAIKTNYYGFLSADYMHLPYQICNQDIASKPIEKMPENLLNAFELFEIGLLSQARSEWIIGYRTLTTPQKRTLADIAYEKGWYRKVSAIMGALDLWSNYKLRYPLAYKLEIAHLAKKHNLLPQWIMSIITQESAWQTDAVSRADARGLMQIIGSTAKRLSKKLGLTYWGKPQLHNALFNLRLGIFYQRELFNRYNNHPLLALASYNAGETKANDWLRGFSNIPDIWAETIPYRETRDYIQKILRNVTIYDWLINQQPKRISYWMPTMPVEKSTSKPWPNKEIPQQTTTVTCQQ